MFESVGEKWKRYLVQASPGWAADDVRHELGAEVSHRLRYLDLIIRHLNAAIEAVTPDPAESEGAFAWMRICKERIARDEMSNEEFAEGMARIRQDFSKQAPGNIIDNWDAISVFTEIFHLFAWRLREVLNRKGPYAFPKLGKIEARSLLIVRNNLIEHPEDVRIAPQFNHSLVILSTGPVLRSTGGVIRATTQRTEPLPDSRDPGLFEVAEELRQDLERALDKALADLAG
jgi:hypothetical protein